MGICFVCEEGLIAEEGMWKKNEVMMLFIGIFFWEGGESFEGCSWMEEERREEGKCGCC